MALFPYQHTGVAQILKLRDVLLADPPGAGKTAQVVTAWNELDAHRVLVVCPASLRINWAREVAKWSRHHYTTIGINSSKELPCAMPLNERTAVIVSYAIAATKDASDILSQTRWDVAVFDEAHALKNVNAKRTKACLLQLWPAARKRIAITGTPFPNGRAYEAWPLFARLSPRLFGQFKPFRDEYTIPVSTGYNTWDYTRSKNLDKLGALARQHFMIRRSVDEVLGQLPPLVRQQIPLGGVKEPHEVRELDLDELVASIERGEPIWSDHLSTARRLLGIAKIAGAADFVTTLLAEEPHLVVFAHHTEVLAGLAEALDAANVTYVTVTGGTAPLERQQAVDDFQAGRVQVFLGSLLACNTGITLTRAAALVIVEQSWTPEDNAQAEARIYRLTQRRISRIFYLMIPDSIDERIAKAVLSKQRDIATLTTDNRTHDANDRDALWQAQWECV